MTLMTNVPFKPLDSWTVKGSELQLQTPPSNSATISLLFSRQLRLLGVVSSAAAGRGQGSAL